MIKTLFTFASRDGISSLWQGLSASILRQSTYSTARLGLYNYLAHSMKKSYSLQNLSTSATVACAGVAGAIAGLIGNPTEVVLVRMCADGAKPPAQRFCYGNAINGLIRIAREEGVQTFSKGLVPNITRSILMSEHFSPEVWSYWLCSIDVSQIAVYTAAKAKILATPALNMQDGVPTHIAASLVAGTVATTACAPADVLKSRMQNTATNGKPLGILKAAQEGLKQDGLRFLMKGWTPAWLRLTWVHLINTATWMTLGRGCWQSIQTEYHSDVYLCWTTTAYSRSECLIVAKIQVGIKIENWWFVWYSPGGLVNSIGTEI
jgi:dicarboxylate transporter 10